MDELIGFLIGTLCGIIPLMVGLFTKHRLLGIIGVVATALSGVVFVLLEKSPFIAIGVAAVFVVFNFAKYKKNNQNPEEDPNDSDD